MTSKIDKLLKELHDFEKTEDSAVLEVQLSYAQKLMKSMRAKNMSPAQLAQKARMRTYTVCRILCANKNLDTKTMGKLLWLCKQEK